MRDDIETILAPVRRRITDLHTAGAGWERRALDAEALVAEQRQRIEQLRFLYEAQARLTDEAQRRAEQADLAAQGYQLLIEAAADEAGVAPAELRATVERLLRIEQAARAFRDGASVATRAQARDALFAVLEATKDEQP